MTVSAHNAERGEEASPSQVFKTPPKAGRAERDLVPLRTAGRVGAYAEEMTPSPCSLNPVSIDT